MEEIKDFSEQTKSEVTVDIMPGFTTQVVVEDPKDIHTEVPGGTPDDMPNAPVCENAPEKKETGVGRLIFDILMVAAVVALFVLHFCGGKKTEVAAVPAGTPGNGDIVFVNIDTINAQYELVSILTDSLEAEKQTKTVLFQNRQAALEQKLANYQRNMQSGQLTAQQAQYAEASLQEESQKLQNDYAVAMESLETRYAAALNQIADSLKAVTLRVNQKHNASFVFSYVNGGQIISTDPTKDITNEVLSELNKSFKKSKKRK